MADRPATDPRRLSKLEQAVVDAQGKGQPLGTAPYKEYSHLIDCSPAPVPAASVLNANYREERLFVTQQDFDYILKWLAEDDRLPLAANPIHVYCARCAVLFPLSEAAARAHVTPLPGGDFCPKCENSHHSTLVAYRTMLGHIRSRVRTCRFWFKMLFSKKEEGE